MYSITYSVGTTRHDEKRYIVRDIPADRLAAKITSLQANGRSIFEVTRTSGFGA